MSDNIVDSGERREFSTGALVEYAHAVKCGKIVMHQEAK